VKIFKRMAIAVVTYVGIVIVFESLIGVMQPSSEGTLVITTFEAGTPHERVVSRIDSDGKLYVAANHWPREWYDQARVNPDVQVTMDGKTGDYRAVPIDGAEHDRVAIDKPLAAPFRVLTGFPPRYFLRLDPR
jgi:hypothetical protein